MQCTRSGTGGVTHGRPRGGEACLKIPSFGMVETDVVGGIQHRQQDSDRKEGNRNGPAHDPEFWHPRMDNTETEPQYRGEQHGHGRVGQTDAVAARGYVTAE